MAAFILLLLLLSIVFPIHPHPATCAVVICPKFCSEDGPEIRFPFCLKTQPKNCGCPGFEMECMGKEAVIDLPPAGRVVVSSIFYGSQTLFIKPPRKCATAFFIDFQNHTNSVNSPFHLATNSVTTTNDVLFNCSKEFPHTDAAYAVPISCASNQRFRIYAVPIYAYLAFLPRYCTRRMALPVESYKEDGDIGLAWDVPRPRPRPRRGVCGYCGGGRCGVGGTSPLPAEGYKIDKPHPEATTALDFAFGVAAGLLILLPATLIVLRIYCSQRKRNSNEDIFIHLKVEEFLKNFKSMKPMRYSYADVRRMTQKFKGKLGEGGYGSVYKGILPNGSLAAVKILKGSSHKDGEEFINEVITIGRIHHINVVRLLGFCVEGSKRALIYEFMPNESLEKYISQKNGNDPLLSWQKLQKIAVGVAKGMEYLHQGCDQRILHFDIKPHNILLDENYNPKISDFGLAKLCSKGQSEVSMTSVRGTMGYMAPEVVSMNFGSVSHKSDVYSFGMLLLEMVGGRKNIICSEMVGGGKNIKSSSIEILGEVHFQDWIYDFPHQADQELGTRIREDGDAMIAKKLTIVAFWCVQWHPADRPSMKTVVQMLEGNVDSLTVPTNPFSLTAPPTENDAQKTEKTACII